MRFLDPERHRRARHPAGGRLLGACGALVLALSACASSATPPPDSAGPDAVLEAYLGALSANDCGAARTLSVQSEVGFKWFCGQHQVVRFWIEGESYPQRDTHAGFTTTLTIVDGDDLFHDGDHTIFFHLRREPGGPWRVSEAGTGP